ncbi:MAG: class I SAM-dependent methyltransferase, partial [Methylococcaceae bacterium]
MQTYYGYDDSPLQRMINISEVLGDEEFILRVNGINFCVDAEQAEANVAMAQASGYDCIRFPDDFPALFTSDVYRVGALRRMMCDIQEDELKFHIHPKYYLSRSEKYNCYISLPDFSKYTDEYILSTRMKYKDAMHTKRIEVDSSKAIKAGDTIHFHYELAKEFLNGTNLVLDLACGSGFGATALSSVAQRVIGIDNDEQMIVFANKTYKSSNTEFLNSDVLNIPFNSNSIDAIVAFEIIEHLDPVALLNEFYRVLKPNGIICLSTPQNSLGHIPTTSDHIREFSLVELKALVEDLFSIEQIIGIKQGS